MLFGARIDCRTRDGYPQYRLSLATRTAPERGSDSGSAGYPFMPGAAPAPSFVSLVALVALVRVVSATSSAGFAAGLVAAEAAGGVDAAALPAGSPAAVISPSPIGAGSRAAASSSWSSLSWAP